MGWGCWGLFGTVAHEFCPSVEGMLGSRRGDAMGAECSGCPGGGFWGGCRCPLPGTPTHQGCSGHGRRRHLAGSASQAKGAPISMATPGGPQHPARTGGHPPAPRDPPPTMGAAGKAGLEMPPRVDETHADPAVTRVLEGFGVPNLSCGPGSCARGSSQCRDPFSRGGAPTPRCHCPPLSPPPLVPTSVIYGTQMSSKH